MDYNVSIKNNFSVISLKHRFANPLDRPLDICFSFPIDTNFCFSKLEAQFDGYRVAGVVKDRKAALQEYQAEK